MPKILFLILILSAKPSYAYIDPATGNAFFTLAITIISAILFGLSYLWEHIFIFKGFFQKNKKNIPLLLYSEGNTYWPWFEPILDELEKRKITTEYYTSADNDLCFEKKYQYIHPTFIGKGNRAYAKMAFVKADIVLMTTPGLDVYQLKRSKYVKKYVHFYHSCDDGCMYKLFGTDYYDVILTDNDTNGSYIRELESKRNLPEKELVVVGNILLDKLQERAKNLKEKTKQKKTILLSPSWGRESVLYQCGEKLIENLLETPYQIIIRPHPQIKIDNPDLLKNLTKKYPENNKLHWDFDPDNLPSMAKADLMISDFSSIIFEYVFTFKRPVITLNHNMNLEQYDASDISSGVWRFKVLDDIGRKVTVEQTENISKIISEVLNTFKKDSSKANKLNDVINTYWTNKGQCIINIVNYIQNQLKNEN